MAIITRRITSHKEYAFTIPCPGEIGQQNANLIIPASVVDLDLLTLCTDDALWALQSALKSLQDGGAISVTGTLDTSNLDYEGVASLHADSNPPLNGPVELISGTGVTLLQTGQTITITSTSGGGGITQLTSDVTAGPGTGSQAATVASVGGSSAANIHTSQLATAAATDANTVSTIVKRDASGNFAAGTITASLTGHASLDVPQSEVGASSGVASLDGGGKVPLSQLPSTLMEFKGNWNPSTNIPALVDGTGTTGFTYWVSAAFAGPVAGLTDPSMVNFQIGDLVIYNGTKWVLVTPAAGVQSVNGAQGAVTVNAISQLTSDVTAGPATGSQSVAATLATVNSNVGSFTNANITVDGKGRIIAAASGTDVDSYLPLTGGTLTGALTITPTTNQLILGTTNTVTISATQPVGPVTVSTHSISVSGLATSASTSIGDDLANFSVSLWFKNGALGGGGIAAMISKLQDTSGPFGGWWIGQTHGGGTLYLLVQSDSSNYLGLFPANVVNDNVWHNLVVVKTITPDLLAYLDGVQVFGSAPSGTLGSISNSYPVTLGSTGDGANPYTGLLDDVRIYNVALSSSDVTAIATGHNPFHTPISYWPIEEGSGTTIADVSGNSNNITLTPAAFTWSTDVPVPPLSSSSAPFSRVYTIPDQGANANIVGDKADYTLSGAITFAKAPILPTISYTASTSSPYFPDATLADVIVITVDADLLTVEGPSNPYSGQKIMFQLHNDGSHAVTFATGTGNFRFGTDIPSYTAVPNKTDYVGVVYNAADTVWDIVSVSQGF